MSVPPSRIHLLNTRPLRSDGKFVLYWMITARRLRFNFALQHAVEFANTLRLPLVIFEALRCDYPWANDRLHAFAIEGMAANASGIRNSSIVYYPYVEPRPHHARGLLRSLSADAAVIVTDFHPGFFIPRMLASAPQQAQCRLEAIDSNGLIPLADHGRAFPTARGYRAFVQRSLRTHLHNFPESDPLHSLSHQIAVADIPSQILSRWPAAEEDMLRRPRQLLATLPIDHSVAPVEIRGGSDRAAARLRQFVADGLPRYGEDSNHPDLDATSRLSPYFHFGHMSAHEVFAAVMTAERWTTRKLSAAARGAREAWWGTSPSAEKFLDQLVVWRELAFNGSHYIPHFGTYPTLPAWARQTLEKHQSDRRPHLYDVETLEAAATHDPVWNAAMQQLKREGWFHGYMRMLWGKKILEWSKTPDGALAVMEHLMNRYSLDGRDPVSYASYGWVLGLYDRPWPERPVFGVVRAMTSESARRKLKLKNYLATFSTSDEPSHL